MGARASSSLCCSVRDKNGYYGGASAPFWHIDQVEIQMTNPEYIAYGPLWATGQLVAMQQRLALASGSEVQVYRVDEDGIVPEMYQPKLELRIQLQANQAVTGLIFLDDNSARNLIVAYGPAHEEDAESSTREAQGVSQWNLDIMASKMSTSKEGIADGAVPQACRWIDGEQYCVNLITDHLSIVTGLAVNSQYLITADNQGHCMAWQKAKVLIRRGANRLHRAGIADITVDKSYAYSAGKDGVLGVWSLPDLEKVISVVAEIPAGVVPKILPEEDRPVKLTRLTSIRRPCSRWANYAQNSRARSYSVFVAGVIADDTVADTPGAGVLMEWLLGAKGDRFTCVSSIIAHETEIVSLAHGPYDNGPIITADASGVYRVWDSLPRSQLCQSPEMKEEIRIDKAEKVISDLKDEDKERNFLMAVVPQRGIFASMGDNMLLVWRRYNAMQMASDTAWG